ncbi:peptidase M14 [Alteromonas aestuariivivens]|uniref:Peptidase M14 n=1 Tax=Alteromonas aestuariivivens TaxID=1938339 RepID=A0A3D8MAX0_9ALTE|nr:M14 family zinc carboxypeptidase [Alteromonas aestuariivivens]RDV26632.1 peptidase M14 [Alteromonas aestuariivivens]
MNKPVYTPATLAAGNFKKYHWPELNRLHLTFGDIEPVLNTLARSGEIDCQLLGHSYAGVPIQRLSIGRGPRNILAWTQMHGDEATATAAVLDWLHWLNSGADTGLPADWKQRVSIHIIPMLNPDGAAQCTRHNAQGIDINRDALGLQTPEGAILMSQAQLLEPEVAFNLHDQNAYYSVGETAHPSTIAFLAPAFNTEKQVDDARYRAKQLIACMQEAIRHWLPNEVARYDDTYSKRCFGDNIAALSISTILIESGAGWDDPHRQTARKMNVVALHSALAALLDGSYRNYTPKDYYHIPENREDGFCDLKIEALTVPGRHLFVADMAINIDRHSGEARIAAIGDLCVMQGFKTLRQPALQLCPRKGFAITGPMTLDDSEYLQLMREGVGYFYGDANELNIQTTLPVLVVSAPLPELPMPGDQACLLLSKPDSAPHLAILNGQPVEF